MRLFGLIVALFVSSAALAVEPGDTVYLKGDVDSSRFLDDPTPGPTFNEDARVTVLFRVGDRVRVFVGDKFGWVRDSAVTTEAPAGATPSLPPEILKQIREQQPED